MSALRSSRLRGILGLAAIAVVLVLLPFIMEKYMVYTLTMVAIYAISILGLDILTGRTGQISLGHAAFYGVGAYTAALLMTKLDFNYLLSILAAGLVAAFVGLLIGIPELRLRGLALALVTFAFATAVGQILKRAAPLTGGVSGVRVVRPDVPFGLDLSKDQWLYFVVIVVAVVLFAAAWSLSRNRVGRGWLALKDSELAAASSGVNVSQLKLLGFVVSSFYAGVAGGLSAIVVGFISPEGCDFFLTVGFLVGMVVGGVGTLTGPIIGALFVVLVPDYTQQISQSAPSIIYGALLIAVLFFAPGGIVGALRRFWPWMGRRFERTALRSVTRASPTPTRSEPGP